MALRHVVIAVLKRLAVLVLWMLLIPVLLLVLLFLPLSPIDTLLLLVFLVISIVYYIFFASVFKRREELPNINNETAATDGSTSMVTPPADVPTEVPPRSEALAGSSGNDVRLPDDTTDGMRQSQAVLAIDDDNAIDHRRDYNVEAARDPVSSLHPVQLPTSDQAGRNGGNGGPVAAFVSNSVPLERTNIHQPEPFRADSLAFHPPDTTTRTISYEDRPLPHLNGVAAAAAATTTLELPVPPMVAPEAVQRGEANMEKNGGDLPNVTEEQRESGDDTMDCEQLTADDISARVLALDETQQETLVPFERHDGNVQDSLAGLGTAAQPPPSATATLPSSLTENETGILNQTSTTASATTANPETLTSFLENKNELDKSSSLDSGAVTVLEQPQMAPESVHGVETNKPDLAEIQGDPTTTHATLEDHPSSDVDVATDEHAPDRIAAMDGTRNDSSVLLSEQYDAVVVYNDGLAGGTAVQRPPSATSTLLALPNSETDILNQTGGTEIATAANPETLTLFLECEKEGYDIYRAFVPVCNDILLGCNTFGMLVSTSYELPSGLVALCPGYTRYASVCSVRRQSVAKKVGFTRRDVLCLVDLDGSAAFAGSIRLFTEDEYELYFRRSRKGSVILVCVARPRSTNRKHPLESTHLDNEPPQQVTQPFVGQLQPPPKRSRHSSNVQGTNANRGLNTLSNTGEVVRNGAGGAPVAAAGDTQGRDDDAGLGDDDETYQDDDETYQDDDETYQDDDETYEDDVFEDNGDEEHWFADPDDEHREFRNSCPDRRVYLFDPKLQAVTGLCHKDITDVPFPLPNRFNPIVPSLQNIQYLFIHNGKKQHRYREQYMAQWYRIRRRIRNSVRRAIKLSCLKDLIAKYNEYCLQPANLDWRLPGVFVKNEQWAITIGSKHGGETAICAEGFTKGQAIVAQILANIAIVSSRVQTGHYATMQASGRFIVSKKIAGRVQAITQPVASLRDVATILYILDMELQAMGKDNQARHRDAGNLRELFGNVVSFVNRNVYGDRDEIKLTNNEAQPPTDQVALPP